MNRPDIWEYILSSLPPPFDPNVSLLGAILLEIKTLSMIEVNQTWVEILLRRYITLSITFEKTRPDLHINSLKDLDRTITKCFEVSDLTDGAWFEPLIRLPTSSNNTFQMHWTTLIFGNRTWDSFFHYAIEYPLPSFIDHELKTGRNPNSLVAGQPLLYAAVLYAIVKSMSLRLIEILLNHGADPNLSGGTLEVTPWKFTLHQYSRPMDTYEERIHTIESIISIFLDNNADPRIIVDGKSVEDVIKTAFIPNRERTDELLRKVTASRKRFKDSKKSPFRMKTILKRLGRHGSNTT